MENIYHATPYDISATGFYFSDYDDYRAKAATHRNEYGDPVEEYEIQFIDGDNCELFIAIGVNQATLKHWFDELESLEGLDAIKAVYLVSCGYDESQIMDRLEEVELYEGSARDYAENLIEDTGMLNELPENLRYYFDVDAYARDLLASGDISELQASGGNYVVRGG